MLVLYYYYYYKLGCSIDGLNRGYCLIKVGVGGRGLVVGGRLDTCYVSGCCVTLGQGRQHTEGSTEGSKSLNCRSLGYPQLHGICHPRKLQSSVKNINKISQIGRTNNLLLSSITIIIFITAAPYMLIKIKLT